jgi:SAM-dependent methyltransferase
MIDLTGRVIADIGCGRSDFLVHLSCQGVQYGRYIGVDGLQEMIEFSRERVKQDKLEEAVFRHADFAHDESLFRSLVKEGAEVFAFSGSLNTFKQNEALEVLERAWTALPDSERAGTGKPSGASLVFNFLAASAKGTSDDPTGPAHRFDTGAMLAWALGRTPRVALRTDYFPKGHDATIAMFV